ncbi:hypothetical protein SESBI_42475 [Sesbania bispinosa]|nr:hypothetical protein SESBI_42475 [Sesbania bispinosa]
MNGAAIDVIDENGNGSDSDANSDDAPEYYQPISAVDDDGISDGENGVEFRQLPNGYGGAENGISSLNLNDGRALSEDENRRNAPLTTENATRVREAMRGVSFAGTAPDWASQVPEDRWIERLRRLRQSPNT